jgi:hypothetical protein
MRLRITQFSDVEGVKQRLLQSFNVSSPSDPQITTILTFLDEAKARIDRMQSVNASIHVRKTFTVANRHISVTAETVQGLLPSLWARLTT